MGKMNRIILYVFKITHYVLQYNDCPALLHVYLFLMHEQDVPSLPGYSQLQCFFALRFGKVMGSSPPKTSFVAHCDVDSDISLIYHRV